MLRLRTSSPNCIKPNVSCRFLSRRKLKVMKVISTPKGLQNYYPWGKKLSDLQNTHKDIKILKSATRFTDKAKFKAGQWVKLRDGKEIKILGFDNYNYPLPISKTDKPVNEFHNGTMKVSVYKQKHKKILRAIHAICTGYCFTDLQEWEWLSENGS